MLVYDLIDKICRTWMALMSRTDWANGLKTIHQRLDELLNANKLKAKPDDRSLSFLVASYLSYNDTIRQ
jgi:hypothetical protein